MASSSRNSRSMTTPRGTRWQAHGDDAAPMTHTGPMLSLRILTPAAMTDDVVGVLQNEPCVSGLAVLPGAAIRPVGDLVLADLPRESANEVVARLRELGVHREGTIEIQRVDTWLSADGFAAELKAPGSSADAVVWAEVAQRSYDESELNWTYLSFMSLATLIAAIAIVLDSQILVIGAMVLGPEFGAVAALGVALVRRRYVLFRHAVHTLVLGFAVAIVFTTVVALLGRALGWISPSDVTGHDRRPTSSTARTGGRSSSRSLPERPECYRSPRPSQGASRGCSSP